MYIAGHSVTFFKNCISVLVGQDQGSVVPSGPWIPMNTKSSVCKARLSCLANAIVQYPHHVPVKSSYKILCLKLTPLFITEFYMKILLEHGVDTARLH